MFSKPTAIPASKWAVPLEGVSDLDRKTTFSEAQEILKTLGFECLHSNLTPSMSSLEFINDHSVPELHEVWMHPAGLLALANSYSDKEWTNEDGDYIPVLRRVNTIQVHYRIDLGLFHQKSRAIGMVTDRLPSSSSNIDTALHGTTIHGGYFSSHAQSFIQGLAEIQKAGRLIPCKDWNPNSFLYVATEQFTKWERTPENIGLKKEELEIKLEDSIEQGRLNFVAQMPLEIQELMEKQTQNISKRDHNQDRTWNRIKMEAFDKTGSALAHLPNRWLKPEEKSIVNTWQELATERGLDLEQCDPNVIFAQGPAGLSFAHLLVETQPQLLEKWIELAPIHELEKWVTTPNSTGLTLPLQLAQIALRRVPFCLLLEEDGLEKTKESSQKIINWFTSSWDALEKKVGPDCLAKGLETSQYTLAGVLLQCWQDKFSNIMSNERQNWRGDQLLDFVSNLNPSLGLSGLVRMTELVYQEKGHKGTRDTDKMVTFTIDPQNPTPTQSLYEKSWQTPFVQNLFSLLERIRLRAQLPESTVSASRLRI